MNVARTLREARRRAGLTQRQLAEQARIPQSSVAKIESGTIIPRVDTFDRLLRACGEALEALPRLGIGVDRSNMILLSRLDHAERARRAVEESRAVQAMFKKAPRR